MESLQNTSYAVCSRHEKMRQASHCRKQGIETRKTPHLCPPAQTRPRLSVEHLTGSQTRSRPLPPTDTADNLLSFQDFLYCDKGAPGTHMVMLTLFAKGTLSARSTQKASCLGDVAHKRTVTLSAPDSVGVHLPAGQCASLRKGLRCRDQKLYSDHHFIYFFPFQV